MLWHCIRLLKQCHNAIIKAKGGLLQKGECATFILDGQCIKYIFSLQQHYCNFSLEHNAMNVTLRHETLKFRGEHYSDMRSDIYIFWNAVGLQHYLTTKAFCFTFSFVLSGLEWHTKRVNSWNDSIVAWASALSFAAVRCRIILPGWNTSLYLGQI